MVSFILIRSLSTSLRSEKHLRMKAFQASKGEFWGIARTLSPCHHVVSDKNRNHVKQNLINWLHHSSFKSSRTYFLTAYLIFVTSTSMLPIGVFPYSLYIFLHLLSTTEVLWSECSYPFFIKHFSKFPKLGNLFTPINFAK